MKLKPLEVCLVVVFVAILAVVGWFLSLDASRSGLQVEQDAAAEKAAPLTKVTPEETGSGNTPSKSQPSNVLDTFFSIPNERVVTFENEKDYREFLASLKGSGLRLLGSIDPFFSVRIGFDRLSDLEGILDDDKLSLNYVVSLPPNPTDSSIQFGAVGFNGNALQWLGIEGDNSSWGEGVVIAVIDTGIVAHPALSEDIRHFNLSDSDGEIVNGHGTAVASLVNGQNEFTPGVSPAASILDIRIADDSGGSSSFQLAEGILLAVQQGAQVINISMGSLGDSSLVRRAVEFAAEQGVVIVAPTGNDGLAQLAFPAGFSQVVAVGAVDRNGTLVDFSNTGSTLDLTAPGLQVNAAWTDGRYIAFTGTSASAPYVAGAIAAGMSQLGLSAKESTQRVLALANESGPPGADFFYGNGLLDPGRVMRSEEPGLYDLAAAASFVSTDGEGSSLIAIVQNQGTATIQNATATVLTATTEYPLSIPSLAPGEVKTFELPFAPLGEGEIFTVVTDTNLGAGITDIEPSNNSKQTIILPTPKAP